MDAVLPVSSETKREEYRAARAHLRVRVRVRVRARARVRVRVRVRFRVDEARGVSRGPRAPCECMC